MKPGALPMELYRGDSGAWECRFFDDEDKTIPSDLTGVVPKAQIRDRSGGELITELVCTLTLPNVILVELTATASKELRITRGFWDLQLTYPDDAVRTMLAGAVTVTPDITDSDPLVLTPV